MRILDLSDFILSVTIITVMMPLYVGGWILDSTLELLPIGSKIRDVSKWHFSVYFSLARRKPQIAIEPASETKAF